MVASSKGGAGKTTLCMVIASEMSRQGIELTIIDADPNQHFADWGRDAGFKNVISSSQNNIITDIKEAQTKTAFVIVDLEGTANVTMGYAINLSDFVVIPCQTSDLDGKEAVKVINFIREQDEFKASATKFAILRTKTSALRPTNIEKALIDDFKSIGCKVLKNRLLELVAYRTIISNRCMLHDLKTTTKKQEEAKQNAIEIAHDITLEIVEMAVEEVKVKNVKELQDA